MASGGRSLCVLRREEVQDEIGGRTVVGWKVGRGMDGITNLGAPRGTGPGGQRRRGLGAGRRGMLSVMAGIPRKTRSHQHPLLFHTLETDGESGRAVVCGIDLQDQGERNCLSFETVTTAEEGENKEGKEERAEAWRRAAQGLEKSIADAAVLMATLTASGQLILTATEERSGYIYYEVVPPSKTTRYIHGEMRAAQIEPSSLIGR